MEIEERLTEGCDRLSRVYGNMFNALQEIMQDKEKLKELSPLDYSAIGLYIGKFVEQEINSSVVQLMRQFCGIEMPDFYCKRDPYFNDDDAQVIMGKNGKYRVNLNDQMEQLSPLSLKTISLGDAYYALKQLKEEDPTGFLKDYPWLSEEVFLEAWRRLFKFRNRVAHIGELVDLNSLEENFIFFERFLTFMPDILELKKKLAPDDYIDSLPIVKDKEQEKERPYFVSTDNRNRPYAPPAVAKRFCELYNMDISENEVLIDEFTDIYNKYYFDAMIFNGPDGKKGLKDCLGQILVPAKFDGFGFIPKPLEYPRESVIAVKDGRFILVALDGTGKELTEGYDYIGLALHAHMYSPYIYRKDGLKSCGFMDLSGKVICDCIVDKYFGGLNSIWYESGEKHGFWQFGNIFLPPIYDDIKMMGDPWDPLIFTLDGVQGLVRHDGSFMPLSEYKKLDEDEQSDTVWDFLCEQYETG